MKILVAPDSFKGTYTAQQVAEAIADGIKQAGAQPASKPAADGGEGTLAALTEPIALQDITVPLSIRGVRLSTPPTECRRPERP